MSRSDEVESEAETGHSTKGATYAWAHDESHDLRVLHHGLNHRWIHWALGLGIGEGGTGGVQGASEECHEQTSGQPITRGGSIIPGTSWTCHGAAPEKSPIYAEIK